jgi:pimeloyl-ACP methyl ester carboxylesterase
MMIFCGLINALGIEKPVDILGLSMGGLIAQELALLHPVVDQSTALYYLIALCVKRSLFIYTFISTEKNRYYNFEID